MRFVFLLFLGAVSWGCGGRDRGSPLDAGTADPGDAARLPGDAGSASSTRIDCIDRRNAADPRCLSYPDVLPGTIGSGPPFIRTPKGGFIEGRTMVVALDPVDTPGYLFSIDLDTGDRTLVSGDYEDPRSGPRTVGAGPAFDRPVDVERGADGWYVLTGAGLVRVDPATGDRELARPFETCRSADGPYQIWLSSFTMDASGVAYVSTINVRTGNGIVAMSPDGTCRVASWSALPGYPNIGTGPTGGTESFSGLTHYEGFLYATDFLSEALYRIDPASGDRIRVSSSYDGQPIGAGPELLVNGYVAFPASGRAFTTGNGYGDWQVSEVDVASGDRTTRPVVAGPLFDAYEPGPSIVIDGSATILGVDEGLIVFEPDTGNSYTLSH
jgi:hypothetical protein